MPRNSNGNYSLPSGNPVSSNTLIESLWANTTLADVAQGLTESLDRYGRGTMLAAFRVADGIVTAPGVAFGSEASTGIYRSGAGVMGLSVLGVAKATLTASAFTFNTAPTWASDPASGNQLTRKTYVDNAIATAGGAFLPLTGGTLTGALTGTVFNGSGSGLTSLNASNLASGTVPNARISGAYTGITTLDTSGNVTSGGGGNGSAKLSPGNATVSGFVSFHSAAGTRQGYIGSSNTSAATDQGTIRYFGGSHLFVGNISGTFVGDGSGITGLNASNLTAGTVPDARISGSYTGITSLTASATITAGISPNGTGKLSPGGATTSGYVAFHAANGVRQGFIGYSPTTAANDAGMIRYIAATHEFTGSISFTGSITGSGSGLTSLNASNLSSGTVPNARISGWYDGISTLTLTDQLRLPAGAAATPSLRWLGDTDTGIYAPNVSQVAICTTGTNRLLVNDGGVDVSGALDVSGAISGASLSGSGSGLTSLNASNLTSGTVPNARISGAYSDVTSLSIGGSYTAGGLVSVLQVNGGTNNTSSLSAVRWANDTSSARITLGKSRGGVGSYAAVQSSDYLGIVQFAGSDGAAISNGPSIQARASQNWTGAANGSNLNFYTVPNGATVGTIALGLNHDNSAEFYGAVTALSFSGSGSGLTSLNASNLSSGTVPNARISGALSGITTLTASGLITAGSFSGSGAALTALDASNLSSGTVPSARVTAVDAAATIGGFDVGYRGMPIVARNSTTAFALTDAGKAIRKSNTTAYTWTINPDATTNFEIGTIIFLLHDSTAGNITVARGSGVALVEGTTDANATLAAGERASIHKVAANRWRLYR